MKVTIDTDKMLVNEKGEVLRGLVFNQKLVKSRYGNYYLTGCYSTFEVNAGFVEIDPHKYPALYEPFAPGDETTVTAYESPEIVAMWYWDGDGDLLIWIKGEKTAVENGDCKKDYVWEEVDVA
jgi:hypothetical protein